MRRETGVSHGVATQPAPATAATPGAAEVRPVAVVIEANPVGGSVLVRFLISGAIPAEEQLAVADLRAAEIRPVTVVIEPPHDADGDGSVRVHLQVREALSVEEEAEARRVVPAPLRAEDDVAKGATTAPATPALTKEAQVEQLISSASVAGNTGDLQVGTRLEVSH